MTYTVIDGLAATTNLTSSTLDMDLYSLKTFNISFQAVATGLNSSDATIKIQHSNVDSDAYFTDITDASLTLASGTSYPTFAPLTFIGARYYRFVFTKNTNAAGTITIIANIN